MALPLISKSLRAAPLPLRLRVELLRRSGFGGELIKESLCGGGDAVSIVMVGVVADLGLVEKDDEAAGATGSSSLLSILGGGARNGSFGEL